VGAKTIGPNKSGLRPAGRQHDGVVWRSVEGGFSILLSVPAHTTIQGHSHQDDRTAAVVSGTWQFGWDLRGRDLSLSAGGVCSEPPVSVTRAHRRDWLVGSQLVPRIPLFRFGGYAETARPRTFGAIRPGMAPGVTGVDNPRFS
jgi:hypothetical protein